MNSSELQALAAALAEQPPSPYARFIPREELVGYAAWTPRLIGTPRALPSTDFQDLSFVADSAPSLRRPTPHLPAERDLHGGAMRPAATPAATPDAREPADVLPANDGTPPRPAQAPVDDLTLSPDEYAQLLAEYRAEAEAERELQVRQARQTGYQDGYRDGLAALDSFKQSFAQQTTAQVAQLLGSMDQALEGLEQQMAKQVTAVAVALARQVVRSELQLRPGLVAQVAQEAVGALLKTARQVSIALNPDDLALVASACADTLAASGAQLVARPAVARGGCMVDSDIGSIDASIATRWSAAASALGSVLPWSDDAPAIRSDGGAP